MMARMSPLPLVIGTVFVMAWRLRETRRPLSVVRIVAPPLGMLTGSLMFLYPPMQVPPLWALCSFLLGLLVLSYPLLRTSRLTLEEDGVRLQRSRAFLLVLVGLVVLRLALRQYFEQLVTPLQTASLAYLLALGMIVRWRLGMLREFRRLTRR